MQRILVSVTNDLTYDQRLERVCLTLKEIGFDVFLIGRKLPNSVPVTRSYKTYRMKLFFKKGFLFYTEYNMRLFFKLLFTKKDILLSNDIDTLLPNFFVSKILNKKLVFDSHELFSEIPELVDRPKIKRFWLRIEKWILPKLKNCYTVSSSISNHYKGLYKTDFKVVRNLPAKESLKYSESSFKDPINKKVILYQGAVNIGRGIELMIEAMSFIENALFIIVGDGDILKELQSKTQQLELKNKVRFLGKVSPQELRSITPQATIGISLEEDLGLNYRYALPNKLFDYIQAKVPVVVSDLPEMKKIVENYDVGFVLKERSTKNLANLINKILKKGKQNWKNQLEKASNELIWEKESINIKKLFKNLR